MVDGSMKPLKSSHAHVSMASTAVRRHGIGSSVPFVETMRTRRSGSIFCGLHVRLDVMLSVPDKFRGYTAVGKLRAADGAGTENAAVRQEDRANRKQTDKPQRPLRSLIADFEL